MWGGDAPRVGLTPGPTRPFGVPGCLRPRLTRPLAARAACQAFGRALLPPLLMRDQRRRRELDGKTRSGCPVHDPRRRQRKPARPTGQPPAHRGRRSTGRPRWRRCVLRDAEEEPEICLTFHPRAHEGRGRGGAERRGRTRDLLPGGGGGGGRRILLRRYATGGGRPLARGRHG